MEHTSVVGGITTSAYMFKCFPNKTIDRKQSGHITPNNTGIHEGTLKW